ncbi:MAG: glycerol-3-phosphate dehydrogenase [Gammaproteobacteria bacterium]|nr:MAG: glycerol-3-phosphate dehydrogenase [Gammaproteobacteria bacterium]
MAILSNTPVDLLVVGGGINGAGIAADAAGRGLSVLLCEQSDLASATSSASSKLIHGGLRYLEHYEFRLVREALAEREVLLRNAPHLVSPLRFVLPHAPHLRPAWMIRTGLFLYDHLSKRVTLPGSRKVTLTGGPLKPAFTQGFEYSDCQVDDARLVVANALQARQHGARILTRTRCVSAARQISDKLWKVRLHHLETGREEVVFARALINAAGPWVKSFIETGLSSSSPRNIRLVKGSHILVPRFHDAPNGFILQNRDGRIVFVLPWGPDLHMIGTTDVPYTGDPSQVAIDDNEIDYLLALVNEHFRHPVAREDIVATFSGVRPLCDDESSDPSAVTRDYTLETNDHLGAMPLLSVFGGKLTTYRKLALAAMNALKPYFPSMGPTWTQDAPLPGSTRALRTRDQVREVLHQAAPWLPESLLNRYAGSYGVLALKFLEDATCVADLGDDLGAGLTEAELRYLIHDEWARTPDDVLRRRTGLWLQADSLLKSRLEAWFDARGLPQPEAACQSGAEVLVL